MANMKCRVCRGRGKFLKDVVCYGKAPIELFDDCKWCSGTGKVNGLVAAILQLKEKNGEDLDG